jgi:hypothetical protein
VPKKNKTVVGFRERSTTLITDLKTCEVLTTEVAQLIEPLSTLITAMSVATAYCKLKLCADTAIGSDQGARR